MNLPFASAHPEHMHFGVWSHRRAALRLLTRGWLLVIPVLWAIRWWIQYANELESAPL